MQHLLVHETKSEFEYDQERALRVWHALKDEIAAGWFGDNHGYGEKPNMTDEDRLVELFELLHESQLGDFIFSDRANFGQCSQLVTRGDDE